LNESEIKEILKGIKKPSLLFGFLIKKDISPNIKSYVGGKPYLIKGDKYPVCKSCKNKMNFVFQILVPKEDEKKLHCFYYCFSCMSDRDETFAIKTYKNPDVNEMKISRIPEYIHYAEIFYEPAWSLPDWQQLQDTKQEVAKAISQKFGKEPWEKYDQLRQEITGYEWYECLSFYRGFAQFIIDNDIPICPCCNKEMKPWIQLSSIEELDLIWGNSGCIYIMKCPKDNEHYRIKIQPLE
jgi:uncharacterized protein YwqG